MYASMRTGFYFLTGQSSLALRQDVLPCWRKSWRKKRILFEHDNQKSNNEDSRDLARLLLFDFAVEFREVIQVIFDDAVAVAGSLLQSRWVEDPNHAPTVLNDASLLQQTGCSRNGWARRAEHVADELLRERKHISLHPVGT